MSRTLLTGMALPEPVGNTLEDVHKPIRSPSGCSTGSFQRCGTSQCRCLQSSITVQMAAEQAAPWKLCRLCRDRHGCSWCGEATSAISLI